MKRCRQCNEVKPKSDFYRGHRRCKACICEKQRAYREANIQKVKESKKAYYEETRAVRLQEARKWRLQNKERHAENNRQWRKRNKQRLRIKDACWRYGITPEEFKRKMERQGGVCAICGAKDSGKRSLHVDHCHETGEFRGFLCSECNTGLGKFKEDVALMIRAIDYLRNGGVQ